MSFLASAILCSSALVTALGGGVVSIECAPFPSPSPSPSISGTAACVDSIVNGLPLPSCVGAAFFPPSLAAGDVYRRKISAAAAADVLSPAMIRAYFGSDRAGNVVNGLMWHAGPSQAAYSYGRPLYVARLSDPFVTVHCTLYCAMGDATIRIPALAMPEGGSDHHLAVLEPDGTIFDAWEMSGGPPWVFGSGRATAASLAISTVDGTAYSDRDIAPGFMRNAATAGGAITPNGIITLAELQAGSIQHELLGIVNCTAVKSWYPPATQTARVCTDGRAAIPNGALLQYIPDGTAIAGSSMSLESKIIARAMHEYGVRISDTSGLGGLSIQVESQAPFWSYGTGPDPYVAYAIAHGWSHVVVPTAKPPIERYTRPLVDLDLATNLRVLASGN